MRKRKQRIEPPRCPYCGRRAVLRDASYVYGSHVYNPEQKLYVCAGYPACNSYVGVHLGSLRPKGSLANGTLRNKRILAHKALRRRLAKRHPDPQGRLPLAAGHYGTG